VGPEDRLRSMGLDLPAPPSSLAAYVPTLRWDQMVYVSGQLPLVDGVLTCTGRLGAGVDESEGIEAARRCALNALAALKAEVGDLAFVAQVIKATVFVASDPSFSSQAIVANGASELLVEVFEIRGRHARSAIGVACLPLDAPVELELIVAIDQGA